MKNSKILVAAIALLFVTSLSFGQGTLAKGKAQLNAGVGLSGWGVPVYVGFDFGVHRDITLGVEASFASYRERWSGDYYRHTIMGFEGNGNYHFNRILSIPKEFDFYAGLNLGFYSWSSPDGYHGDHSSGLGLSAQVGGRYFFQPNLGVNLQFGGGSAFSGAKLGITYKF